MMFNLINNSSVISGLINFKSLASNRSVSISLSEPKAILKKFINSFFDFLPAPSAILVGIETAALLNCETNPNFSDAGKYSVLRYISLANSKLNNQASSLLWGLSGIGNDL